MTATGCELTLPSNYRFEIEKCVRRIEEKNARRVALQFPEGLLIFAAPVADILEQKTGAEMVILGDVTYGACCVDDFSATALGCDFLIHYGHSCLISIKDCLIKNMMYVFVEIDIDVQHFVETVRSLVPPTARLACIATIQFVSSMRAGIQMLQDHFHHPIVVPQNKPLSKGEFTGLHKPCTGPGDRRYRAYDPYKKTMTQESYNTGEMRAIRREAVEAGKRASSFALIMGTLGRQGNPKLVDRIMKLAGRCGKTVTLFLMSEIFPTKLEKIQDVDCYIQVACPRLSIDWGYAFDKPLLSPYEAEVAFDTVPWNESLYPMDHYSKDGGKWAVYTDKTL